MLNYAHDAYNILWILVTRGMCLPPETPWQDVWRAGAPHAEEALSALRMFLPYGLEASGLRYGSPWVSVWISMSYGTDLSEFRGGFQWIAAYGEIISLRQPPAKGIGKDCRSPLEVPAPPACRRRTEMVACRCAPAFPFIGVRSGARLRERKQAHFVAKAFMFGHFFNTFVPPDGCFEQLC